MRGDGCGDHGLHTRLGVELRGVVGRHQRGLHSRQVVGCHTRDAQQDTLQIMREEGADQVGGVLHCFTEDWDTAKAALDLGFYISFSGIMTFRNADALRDVVRQVPLDRLLIETDSPYLAPVPYRGKTNQPAYVSAVAACIAQQRNVSIELLAEQTSANFYQLFQSVKRA